MRYAVLSDIHANLEALEAVLAEVDRLTVDRIVVLGDLVGYYASPNECLSMLAGRGVVGVAGNHDRAAAGLQEPRGFVPPARRAIAWTRERLSEEGLAILRALPLTTAVDGRFRMVHAALHPEPNADIYLIQEKEIQASFEALRRDPAGLRVAFFGHTHHPVVHSSHGGRTVRRLGGEVRLDAEDHHLINPGSVGQSRDPDPRASFLIFDAEAATVVFHRVDYDRAGTLARAEAAGLLRTAGMAQRAAWWLSDRLG